MNVNKDKYPISKTMEILYTELYNRTEIKNFKLFANGETHYFTTHCIDKIMFGNGYIDIHYRRLTPAGDCRLILNYKDIVGFDISY